MEIKVINESDITPELDQEIRNALCVCFPEDVEYFSNSRIWHACTPSWMIIVQDAGRVVGHTCIVDRMVRAGEQQIRVAGIQSVFVLPEYRGKGLSDQIMLAAMNKAAAEKFDCGLLFCIPKLESTYVRCGWKTLYDRLVIRIDENGRESLIPEENIAMFYPLRKKGIPDGLIYLQGYDW